MTNYEKVKAALEIAKAGNVYEAYQIRADSALAGLEEMQRDEERLQREAVHARSAIRHATQILSQQGGNRKECLADCAAVLAYEPRCTAAMGRSDATKQHEARRCEFCGEFDPPKGSCHCGAR